MNYTLNASKNEKTGFILYWVTDEKGKVISSRSSKREYVACTIDGRFFFGRLDLIGTGEHGKEVRLAQKGSTCGLINGVLQFDGIPRETVPIAYRK